MRALYKITKVTRQGVPSDRVETLDEIAAKGRPSMVRAANGLRVGESFQRGRLTVMRIQ